MRLSPRVCALLALVIGLLVLPGCTDSMVSSRDDQRTPSVPPAQWENNPLNMPNQGGQRRY